MAAKKWTYPHRTGRPPLPEQVAQLSRSLLRAIQGKGAFRRFKDRLHQNYPYLVPAWHTFQSTRAQRRAIEWLVDQSLIDARSAAAAVARYRDPDLP